MAKEKVKMMIKVIINVLLEKWLGTTKGLIKSTKQAGTIQYKDMSDNKDADIPRPPLI